MEKGIVVAGSLILDRHYVVNTFPEEGRLVQISDTLEDVGGTGNIILDLAKIDKNLKVQVSAILGKGSAGRSVMRQLSKYPNIITDGIEFQGHTPLTLVIDAQDTMQRTFFYMPAACDNYCEKNIEWDKLHADIFQLEYILLMKSVDAPDDEYGTHAGRILAEARRRGMKTSIDVVSEKSERAQKIIQAALKYTDYCIINELEAEEATGIPLVDEKQIIDANRKKVLETLASYGVTTWVIVHSASGSFGLDCKTGECFSVPSLKLPDEYIKGKTGAGDAYCCGVLYAAYKEQTIIDAMKLGTACASCSISEINGTDGMRPYDEVMALYEKYKCAEEYQKI